MGDVLSLLAVAVLLILIVVSVRRQRAATAHEEAQLNTRLGGEGGQEERSAEYRAKVRAAQQD